jgi:hypothetical protein
MLKSLVRYSCFVPYLVLVFDVLTIGLRLAVPSRDRTTLVIEVGAKETEFVAGPTYQTLRDCPRPIVRTPATKIIRFVCNAQQALKNWMAAIVKARDAHIRFLDESRRSALSSMSDYLFEEHAVNLVVSTRVAADSDTDSADFSRRSSAVYSGWEINVAKDAVSETSSARRCYDATRHVRLVQGLDGLGLTLVGKNPVIVQEVEEDGPAFAAGVLAGDVIRAVNGVACLELTHHQVIDLIREALRAPTAKGATPPRTHLQRNSYGELSEDADTASRDAPDADPFGLGLDPITDAAV